METVSIEEVLALLMALDPALCTPDALHSVRKVGLPSGGGEISIVQSADRLGALHWHNTAGWLNALRTRKTA